MYRPLFAWLGAFGSAIEHFERALSVSVPETNDQSSRTVDTYKVGAASYLAIDSLLLGYLDRAVACRDRAVALGRTARPYSLAVALLWAARVDWFRGAERTAGEYLTELLTLARQQDLLVAIADLGLEEDPWERGGTWARTPSVRRLRDGNAQRANFGPG